MNAERTDGMHRNPTARERKALEILATIRWVGPDFPVFTRSITGTVRRHDNVAIAAYYLAGNEGATVHVLDPSEDQYDEDPS